MPPKEEKEKPMLTRRKAQRDALLGLRNSLEKFVNDYDHERDGCQVSVRLDSLDRTYQDFIKVQGEIELQDIPEMLQTHISERVDFETRYCQAKGFLLSKRSGVDLNQSFNASQSSSSSPSFHLRLPKIDLPKFDGDLSRWIGFRDTFMSMVHANADIPSVAKLQYLIQCLEGEAKKRFESVEIEANQYATTWNALLKRYDDKRVLKRQLFRALYELPAVKQESAKRIHCLVDDFDRHVKVLEKLGEPVEHWDTPLISILSYKLDNATLRAWEEDTIKEDVVTYEEFVEFLYKRVRILNAVGPEPQQPVVSKVAGHFPKSTKPKFVSNTASATNANPPCLLSCTDSHPLRRCPKFLAKDVQERRSTVTGNHLCWNCLLPGHRSQKCRSRYTCSTCHEKHHSLLHEQAAPKVSSTPAIVSTTSQPQPPSTSGSSSAPPQVSMAVQTASNTVLLETVVLNVVDDYGTQHKARALLDSASMANFMSGQLAKLLHNRQAKMDISIAGIGVSTQKVRSAVTATIESRTGRFSTKLEFLILRQPSAELPTVPIDTSAWKFPDVVLADQAFNVPSKVDLVIGSEAFWEIHTGRKFSLGDGLPWVAETPFGWTVSGVASTEATCIPRICQLSSVNDRLEAALQRFWEVETIPEGPAHSVQEHRCETFYAETTTRDLTGRYIVRLPRSDDPEIALGDSKAIAERRFLSLERRLERDAATKEAYHKFMDEYLKLDHMEKVNEPVDYWKPHCYLPHHPVFKQSSTTTKVRVVFDASCKTSSGYSVNDTMLVGPVVQPDLLSTLLKFRFQAVALVADVEKMYRQVLMHPEDRPLQRILWRFSPTDPIATYELKTVTYGTASAPFLATRTLGQIAQDNAERHPLAAAAVASDFYVDDLISGAPDVESAIKLRRELSAILSAAGFPLKKWASNSPEVLRDIAPEDLAIVKLYELQDGQTVSTLGLVWEPKSDTLQFNVKLPILAIILTKRKVMSYIATIWDPFGIVGPTILMAKLFMQRLWALKQNGTACEWDTALPKNLQAEWREFHVTIELLSEVRVPRFVATLGATLQLHIFSDASESAYGACCYVRAEGSNGVRAQLLASKSKVASLSTRHSINRLELEGSKLGVRLYKKIMAALKLKNVTVFFWTDSTTVLQWLRSSPSRWKTFVANRVSQIQLATMHCTWGHVPGVDNPADYISRGLRPIDLLNCLCWWYGPPWLVLSPDYWPKFTLAAEDSLEVSVEGRKVPLVAMTVAKTSFSDHLFSLFSSYPKLRRATAFGKRYVGRLQARALLRRTDPDNYKPLEICKKPTYMTQPLTTEELQATELFLCRTAQEEAFAEEISDLCDWSEISSNCPLCQASAHCSVD